MKIVISPAKSLNFETELPITNHTLPVFLKQSRQVHKVLKQKSPRSLANLMSISEKLADLNWQRNQDWKTPFTSQNARPAIFTFDGDVQRIGCLFYSLRKIGNVAGKFEDFIRIVWIA